MHVRREEPADHDAVRTLHRAAFSRRAVDRQEEVVEARLTDELRRDVGFLPHLSLVAVRGLPGADQVVVGHVIGTRGWLEPLGVPALGVGPVGVRPEDQGTGIGTVLVHSLLAVAEAAGERVAVLLGAPAFYRRFDFRPAAELGITAPDPAWGAHFQARHLTGPPARGAFRYAAPFGDL
ncbi:MAG TPA: N-acetyltransferase [Blastococcus sp.]|nr:N-acetyltransferase [Blastococcus sp.]